MRKIQIETAANGFIAYQAPERHEVGMASVYNPHVFETFESLTKWLDKNLEKPAESATPQEPSFP